MKYKYILFDLDGTLIDTNRLIIDTFKYTYKQQLGIDVSEKEILLHFGEPLLTTLERYSKDKAKEMFEVYIKYNESVHDELVKLCSGVIECLEQLKQMGYKMAVVTSKRKVAAIRGLKLFDIEKYFEFMVAVEDTTKHKPEPEPILEALKKFNAHPKEAIMIGDSIFDIESARNAKVDSVLVKWSLADGIQEKASKSTYEVNTTQELLDLLR